MEAAIVDDEKVIREQIKKLAVKYEPDCDVKVYETGEELLAEGKRFDMPKLLYDRYPILTIVVPAILILSLLSILYVVKTFQDMIALNREKNSRIILEKQIGSMQEHIAEIEHVYSGIRSMKHDMKNTLAVIMQLASGKTGEKLPDACLENAELQAYLSELNEKVDSLELQFKTGNSVLEILQ